MVDQATLHRVKGPCYVGVLIRGGTGLGVIGEPNHLLKPQAHPCVMGLKGVEGKGGLLADGQTWCSQHS